MKRRDFLNRASLGSIVLASGRFPFEALSSPEIFHLTIMHTNDVHSRVDPFPMDGSRNEGLGGAAKRASLIKKIRSEVDNNLLLDCGDIFQGTPYFNFYGGEIEMKLMSKMKYDAATIGNHDFDGGIDGLDKQLKHANFPMIISNYDFSDTVLDGKTLPYKIFTKQEMKIGVFGLGIELDSLVPESLYKETRYLDPLVHGQKMATFLKHEAKCDLVICISHLGYKYRARKISDVSLAQSSRDIDIILGGHTHTFMRAPDVQKNLDGKEVIINQAGWAGIMLGRLDVVFEKNRKGKCISCKNTYVG